MITNTGPSTSASFQDDQQLSEGGDKYREQLEEIYQFCSKSFKLTINSPEILFNTINVLIKDMKTLKKENDKMQVNAILNNQDIFSSSNSEFDETNNESEKSKLKSEKIKIARYKKQMSQMQQLIIDQQTKLSDYDTKLQEMNLTIKDLELQNKRYEQENSRLKKEKRKKTRSVNADSNEDDNENENEDNNMIESVVKLFEDLIHNQSEEINLLSNQRNKLSDILHQSDQTLIQMENEYQTLQSQTEDTISSLKASQIQVNQTESIFPSIIEEIHGLDVPYNLISKSESSHDFIIETITNILKKNQQQEKVDDDKVSKDQYEIVLKQLEGSMKFIQNIANASPILDKSSIQQPLYIDSITRTILLTQCARIGHFIDTNSLFAYSIKENKKISLFDPKLLQDPENFLKPILENASEEVMSQSPTRELYALFIGLSEVNKMLLNYIEHFENGNKEGYDRDLENDEREIEDMRLWKNEQENKLRMIAQETGMLNIPLEDVLDHFLNVYLDTVQENCDLQKELQSDRESQDKKDEIEIDAAEIKKQLDGVESSIARDKEKHKKEISQLKKELSKYKAKNSELNDTLKNLNETSINKERKYKKAKQALINLKKLVEEVEEKVQNVTEDNLQLNSSIESLNETIKQQNVEIAKAAEKIQKLHEQKNTLTERLRESEEKNETTLTGIKNRSEMLNEKYSSTIKNLENEVQKARKEVENAEDEKAKLVNQKNDLSNQLVKLRVSERSLKIKLDTLESRNSLNKKENEQVKTALVRSIKAEATMQIERSRDEYEKLKNALLRMLRDKFNITFNKSTASTPMKQKKKRDLINNSTGSNSNTLTGTGTPNSIFNSDSTSGSLANEDLNDDIYLTDLIDNSPPIDDIIQKVETCLQISSEYQEKINEMKDTRNILNIPENESLSKGAKIINDSLKDLMKQNAEFRANSDNVRLRCAEVDRKRNEQERAIKAAAEWEQWSKSILYQITDGTAAIHGTKDVRFLLEEALLSTIGRKGILTKLDILKAEKKIFTTFALTGNMDYLNLSADISRNSSSQPLLITKVGSIRPIMVSIMFVRRLQVISHRLPVKLAPFQKRDESESTTNFSDQ